jgi:hypothetical protein
VPTYLIVGANDAGMAGRKDPFFAHSIHGNHLYIDTIKVSQTMPFMRGPMAIYLKISKKVRHP